MFSGANAVTHAVVDSAGAVVEGAAGAVATAVSKTPGLKNIVKLYVHRWVLFCAKIWVRFILLLFPFITFAQFC